MFALQILEDDERNPGEFKKTIYDLYAANLLVDELFTKEEKENRVCVPYGWTPTKAPEESADETQEEGEALVVKNPQDILTWCVFFSP